jgi:hypothetical protein
VEKLPAEIREQMKDFNLRLNIFVLQHLIYSSFLRYLLFRPFLGGIRIRDVMEKPHVVTSVEKLESATLEEEVCEIAPA